MKNFILMLFLLLGLNLSSEAQELKVVSFSVIANDLSASIEQKNDLNGAPCALLKVLVLDKISGVEGNVIGNAIDKGTEKWIYLTDGSKEIKIKTENHFPLHLYFSKYGINAVEAKRTYVLTLNAIDENKEEVALNLKDPEDQVLMGLKYENASGVKRDFKKAFSYYQKAAKSGYPEGMFRLGECFLYARGVSTNVGKAVYWLTKAADKGDSQAQCDLATLYDLGQSVEKNEKEAIRYYQKAAAQENVTAMTYLAGHYLEGDYGLAKNEARAIDLLKKVRKKGDTEVLGYATHLLANCYQDGIGVPQDLSKAFELYKEVVDKFGDAECAFEVANCLEHGKGVAKNEKEALVYYQRAASLNNWRGCLRLGMLYEKGQWVPKDLKKSFEYYTRAAKNGYNYG